MEVGVIYCLWHWQTVVWTALAIIALIRLNFDYLVITIIAISLTSANTAGYSKCRKGDFQTSLSYFRCQTIFAISDKLLDLSQHKVVAAAFSMYFHLTEMWVPCRC
jgi:hypothetical protein